MRNGPLILGVVGVIGLIVSLAMARRVRPVVAPRTEAYPPERDPRYRAAAIQRSARA
ncbi:MAG: hypothetical protein L0I24_23060 [Pseudonocardia sp.]|nr:hypothetical protein [Pseudonocardia sp.]